MWSFQKAKCFDFLTHSHAHSTGAGLPAREDLSLLALYACAHSACLRNFEYWWRNNLNILTAVSILWGVRWSGRLCGRRSIFFGWQSAAATMGAANVYIYIKYFSARGNSQRPQCWFDKRYLMNYWGQLGFQTRTHERQKPFVWLMCAKSLV